LPGKELVSDGSSECRLQQQGFKKEIGIECRLQQKNFERRSASKIQNSFVLTARPGAAMLANLEKARAAPKDRVYRHQEALRRQPIQSAEGLRRLAEHSGQDLPIKAGMSFRFRLIGLATTRSVKGWDGGATSSGSGGGEGVAQSLGAQSKIRSSRPRIPSTGARLRQPIQSAEGQTPSGGAQRTRPPDQSRNVL